MKNHRTFRFAPQLPGAALTALALTLLLVACEVNVGPDPTPPPVRETGTVSGSFATINADVPHIPAAGPTPLSVPASSTALQADSPAPEFLPGQVLVTLEPQLTSLSLQAQEDLLLQALGAGPELELLSPAGPSTPALLGLARDADVLAAVQRLEDLPGVAAAQPNYIYRLLALPNDPELDQQWPLPLSGVPLAWEARRDSPGVVVAVLDTGFDLNHPDLQGVFALDRYDFCGTPGCTSEDPDVLPDSNEAHGTHVTGIIAALGDNRQGISGVVNAGSSFIVPIKVFGPDGNSTSLAVSNALYWAAGLPAGNAPRNFSPADIINLSFGLPGGVSDAAVSAAISTVTDRGALVVAASGNDGDAFVLFPAAHPEVLAVGSVNTAGRRSCFSNFGPELDLMAGGGEQTSLGGVPYPNCSDPASRFETGVLSTAPGGNYSQEAGTSMAAPVVSGVAALVWAELGAGASAGTVRQRLLDSAYPGGGRSGSEYGRGIVRADTALGFPGPGDPVTVSHERANSSASAVLDLFGGSGTYRLTLPAGLQRLDARAQGTERSLTGSMQVEVRADRTTDVRVLRLAP